MGRVSVMAWAVLSGKTSEKTMTENTWLGEYEMKMRYKSSSSSSVLLTSYTPLFLWLYQREIVSNQWLF